MGGLFSSRKASWTVDQVPDLTGRVIIVTGSNTGIGKEIAKVLLARNARVYMACRSRTRAEAAIEDLKIATPNNLPIFLELDLSDLANVRRSAEEFLRNEKELHVLINNAGIATPKTAGTKDGFEPHFGTNVIGPYLFTRLLEPALLAASAASSNGEKARVVHLSSEAAYFPGVSINYDTLMAQSGEDKTLGKIAAMRLYARSKLGNAVVAREFARQFGDKITHIAVHPGAIQSELQREAPRWIQWIVAPFFRPTAEGAITPLFAGTAPEAAGMNGKFLIPLAKVGKQPKAAESPAIGLQLWQWLEEKTGAGTLMTAS